MHKAHSSGSLLARLLRNEKYRMIGSFIANTFCVVLRWCFERWVLVILIWRVFSAMSKLSKEGRCTNYSAKTVRAQSLSFVRALSLHKTIFPTKRTYMLLQETKRGPSEHEASERRLLGFGLAFRAFGLPDWTDLALSLLSLSNLNSAE